jgi:hypothetical protein
MSERPTDGPAERYGLTDGPAVPGGRTTDDPAMEDGPSDDPAVPGRPSEDHTVPGGPDAAGSRTDGPTQPRGVSERPIEPAGVRRKREMTRVAVLAVALMFIATFAFLTLASVVEGGFSLASLLSVFILVLFGVGIVGALRNPPR